MMRQDDFPRVIMLMHDDPRTVTHDWIQFDVETARIAVAAIVVPLRTVVPHSDRKWRTIPLVTWESPRPATQEMFARQYHHLYKVTKAEQVVCFDWKERLVGTEGDSAYIHHMPRTFRGYTAKLVSRLIHKAVWGTYPDARTTHL